MWLVAPKSTIQYLRELSIGLIEIEKQVLDAWSGETSVSMHQIKENSIYPSINDIELDLMST